MTQDLLLGIDVGTSSVKAGLFRLDGQPAAWARAAYRVDTPRPGWSETPPERWTAALLQCLAALGGDLRRTAGVGFSSLFPALVAMDGDGQPLRPAILYNDQRSAGLATEEESAAVLSLTSNRLLSGTCTLSSLLWLRRSEPETFRRAAMFGHVGSYFLRALTGEWALDLSNAGLSGLVASGQEERYHEELLAIGGVDAGRLPPLLPSCAAAGRMTRQAAQRTGLPEGVPVAAGAGDTVASAFGAGLADGRSAFCGLGSSDCVATVSSEPQRDPRACNMPHCVPGRWLSVATSTSAGAAVEWFGRTFLGQAVQPPDSAGPAPLGGLGGEEGEPLAAGPNGTEAKDACLAALVEQAARRSPPGARGTMFLPYLQGERTPVWDPLARGAFVGMSASTGFEDMARAVLEGTAFAFRDLLGPNPPRRLLAVGGGTGGGLAVSLRAAAAGRTLHVLHFPETAALGAAMLAGVASGAYRSARHALQATRERRTASSVPPDRKLRPLYDQLYARYTRLYPLLKSLFHEAQKPRLE